MAQLNMPEPAAKTLGVVNGPPKIESLGKFYPSLVQNLPELSNGSRSLRFCVCWSHICSGSDFKLPVSVSQRVSNLPFATPNII